MKIIIQDDEQDIKLNIPNFILLNRFSMRILKDKTATNLEVKDLMKLSNILKKSKDLLKDEPVLEIISSDGYVRIDL